MKVPFLDLKWQHEKIKDNLKIRWDNILNNTAFVGGEDLKQFETNFAKYTGAKHCIGVSNGTSAITLGLLALNLPPDSEVITLPSSFIASATGIVHAGLTPIFSDVNLETGNYDFDKLQSAVTPKTKVIMAVHLYGRATDMDKILEFAKRNNLFVVEDSAQAQGVFYKGKHVGTFGEFGSFSFYPGKNLGAYGQAGAVITNNDEVATRIKKLINHGGINKYEHQILGYNERLDNIQAAVLDEKLKHLDNWNNLRISVAKKYFIGLKEIKELKFVSPEHETCKSNYHIFAIRVPDRQKLIDFLNQNGIATNIHYPDALNTFPFLQKSGCKKGDFPIAEKLQSETMSLPIYPGQTDEQVDFVISKIKEFFLGTNASSEKKAIMENVAKIKVGVVGYGYWSPKVINGFKNVKNAQVFAICEKDTTKHDLIKNQIPDVKIYLHFEEMVKDENIQAVVVTTTVSSHYRIAKATLNAGKHVLLEKPMTEEVWQAEELINLASKKAKVLMVDHTFLYMPAVRALKKVIDDGELGKVHSIFGARTNLGLFQKDVDVVYDLAPHDFSILDYLLNESPKEIIKTGSAPISHKFYKSKIDSLSNLTLKYASGKYVNLFYSWISPIKDRKIYILGDKKMAVFDMMDKEGQLKIFDSRVEVLNDADLYGAWFNYSNGTYRIVDLGKVEGDDIFRMASEFINSILENRKPLTDGEVGKKVVRSLKRAANFGKPFLGRRLGNLKNNFKRILNGNLMLR